MYTRKCILKQAFLKLEKNCNVKKMENIDTQLKEAKIASEKDTFLYLQNNNTIDLLKKQNKQLDNRNIEINIELQNMPRTQNNEICNILQDYCLHKQIIEKEMYKKRMLIISMCFAGASLLTTILIRSRK